MKIKTIFLHLLCFIQFFMNSTFSRIIISEKIFSFTVEQDTQSETKIEKQPFNVKTEIQNIAQNLMNEKIQSFLERENDKIIGNRVQNNGDKTVNSDMSSKTINLYQNQRKFPPFSSAFSNDQEDIYTNELSLFSSIGAQTNSKTMEYIKIKIRLHRNRIAESNKLNQGSYQLAQNKFIIYTPDEFKNMFLTLKEPNQTQHGNYPQVAAPQRNLRILQEVNINWKAAKKMTSVKFQKQCGACYSFTSIGAIQSMYLIQKGQNLNLAEQQVIDCSSPFKNYGCIGGWTINAYKYIQKFGILFESDYPFKAAEGSCNIPESKPKYRIKGYVEIKKDCNKVIEALRNHPLSIAINADGWQYYSSGVYTDCAEGPSNHGVILAGADSQTWLIKNSWGFTWGEQGYIRVSRKAKNEACNVCKWASYPLI